MRGYFFDLLVSAHENIFDIKGRQTFEDAKATKKPLNGTIIRVSACGCRHKMVKAKLIIYRQHINMTKYLYIRNLMKLNPFILAALTSILLAGCKNDIDINAPWKETPVIYSFLDANKTTQYIRVQKTYQNSIDLTTAEGAKISDSLYFKDGDINVQVIASNGIAYTFTRTNLLPKDQGFFASDVNFIYQNTNMPVDVSRTYNLQVTSKITGTVYTSTSKIVGKADIMSVSPGYKLYIRPWQDFNRLIFQFTPGANASLYDVLLRFYYKEYPTGNPANAVIKSVDYFFEKSWNVDATSGKTYLVTSRDLIFYLKNAIKPDNSVTREFQQIDYVATGGSKEMKDIIDLSKPSAVIVQRKTDYSNINGGLGIFSSRSETVKANMPLQNNPTDNGVDSSKIYLVKDLPNFIY